MSNKKNISNSNKDSLYCENYGAKSKHLVIYETFKRHLRLLKQKKEKKKKKNWRTDLFTVSDAILVREQTRLQLQWMYENFGDFEPLQIL